MKEKVTSYTISKRLHELGFDGESHCGWIVSYLSNDKRFTYEKHFTNEKELKEFMEKVLYIAQPVKAYDCWDFLMWLAKETNIEIKNVLCPFDGHKFEAETNPSFQETHCCKEPQNALGLAVIKILEERR